MRAIPEDFERLHINDIVIQVVNLSRATYKEANVLKKNLDELISLSTNNKKL